MKTHRQLLQLHEHMLEMQLANDCGELPDSIFNGMKRGVRKDHNTAVKSHIRQKGRDTCRQAYRKNYATV